MPPPALLTPGVQGLEHTCDGVLVGRITTGVLVGKTTVGFHVRVGSGRFKMKVAGIGVKVGSSVTVAMLSL